MAIFEFRVHDSAGFWGNIRADADTLESAERLIRGTLDEDEVGDNGTLLPDYELTQVLFPLDDLET